MARNGAGVYTLPDGYLAETGDLILADQHNSPLEDLQTDANTPRPIVAGGTGAASATTARSNLSVMSIAEIQSGYIPKVATKAALSALDTASFKAAVLTEPTREKLWMWKSGDFSAEEAADTDNVNYIPADGVSTSLGCWVAATGDGVTVRTIAAGGTGADNAADARTNLGLDIGTGSDLSIDPDKLAKRGDVSDFVDLLSGNTFNVIDYILLQTGGSAELAKIKTGDTDTQDAAIVTAGIQAAVDAAKVSGTPATVYFPSGKYRTNDQISTAGATTSLLFLGDGKEVSVLYLDFSGSDKAGILFSDDYTIANGIVGIGTLGRNDGNTDNPMGMLALRQTSFLFRDYAARSLRNTGAAFVGLTNARITDFQIRAGYQPINGYQPTIAPTCDVSGTTITINTTETIFDTSSVGKVIHILGAGEKLRLKEFQTTIASVTNGQTAELTDSAPTAISDTKWCWAAIRGSMTAGGDTLTLDNGVLSSSDVGRFVTVRLVKAFTSGDGYSNNCEGSQTFKISAVSSPTTCTLVNLDGSAAAADKTVSSVEVFFAPGMAFYRDYSNTTNVDDVVIDDGRIERHEGPGIIAQKISSFRIGKNVKIHGKAWEFLNTVNMAPRNPCAIFASDVISADFNMIMEYGSSRYPGGGQIVIEAARGAVFVSSPWSGSKCDGGKIVSAHEITEDFRLVLGDIYDNDEAPDNNRDAFYVVYGSGDPQIQGSSIPLSKIIQVGEYVPRSHKTSLTGGVNRAPGFSSANRFLNADDTVISFYPPETRGTIELFSSRANVYGRFKFRTSDNQSAPQLTALGSIGSEVAVSGTSGVNTLTGTTGTDGFVNISVDGTSGEIHIENRVVANHDLTWAIFA